jgi:hypothetical protein
MTKKVVSAHKSTGTAPPRLTSQTVVRQKGKLRCTATASTGKPCSRPRWRSGKFCYLHTEGNASAIGKIGGRRRAVYNPVNLEPLPVPRTASDLLVLVATTISEVRAGRMDAKTANAIFAGAGAFSVLLEKAVLEDQVKQLEALEAQRTGGKKADGAGLLRMPN